MLPCPRLCASLMLRSFARPRLLAVVGSGVTLRPRYISTHISPELGRLRWLRLSRRDSVALHRALATSMCCTKFSTSATDAGTATGEAGQKQSFFAKNALKITAGFLVVWSVMAGTLFVTSWGAPVLDENDTEIRDEFSDITPRPLQYFKRSIHEGKLFYEYIVTPGTEKLLPDPVQPPLFQPPYTLVIELNGVLLKPVWSLETGWRFKKRPGLDYFLQQVGPPLFEVVLFTDEAATGGTAMVVGSLNKTGAISHLLWRDSTRYVKGKHIKDLSCLNRDLSKVIMLDWNADAISMQPRNAVKLSKWNGDDADHGLVDLAAFLQAIALNEVDDVRPVLDHYNQFSNPLAEFRENARRLNEFEAEMEQKKKKKPIVASTFSKYL